jgi:hypothetical protein
VIAGVPNDAPTSSTGTAMVGTQTGCRDGGQRCSAQRQERGRMESALAWCPIRVFSSAHSTIAPIGEHHTSRPKRSRGRCAGTR